MPSIVRKLFVAQRLRRGVFADLKCSPGPTLQKIHTTLCVGTLLLAARRPEPERRGAAKRGNEVGGAMPGGSRA